MKLSNRSIYAIRAVFDLAFLGGGQATQIKDIAERQSIPSRFLEQIFQDLKRAGIVGAKRGPRGGYHLAQAPEAIRVGDVVRAVEGAVVSLAPSGEAEAPRESISETVTGELFQALTQQIERSFDEVTVASLAERAEALSSRRGPPRRYSYSI